MSTPFFYQPSIGEADAVILSEETSKHCIQVLRMKAGEQINLTDGLGNLHQAIITTADKKHSVATITKKIIHPPKEKKITICISLLKNATRLEWFLEKATEIGVSNIVPLLCKRTDKQHFRFDRMKTIVISAMLQSQQTWLPTLYSPIIYTSFIQQPHLSNINLIAHCEEYEKKSIHHFLNETSITILIGPEGDFTKEEINIAIEKNYIPISLGNTRLRTETAGMVAAALLTTP